MECVCVWNIWRDVKLLTAAFTFSPFACPLWNLNLLKFWFEWMALHVISFSSYSRGHAAIMQTHANEAMHDGGSRGRSPWCTCIVVITCCSGFASFQFSMSDDGKRLDPRTSKSFLQFSALLSQSVKMGTIWLSWKGRVSFKLMSSSTDYDGDGSFLILLGSFHRPIPVRYNWSVFARKMRSTTQLAMIVLSKCVYVCTHTQSRLFILLCADWYVIPASGCRAGGEMGTTRFLDANQTGPWHATIWESGNGPYWAILGHDSYGEWPICRSFTWKFT